MRPATRSRRSNTKAVSRRPNFFSCLAGLRPGEDETHNHTADLRVWRVLLPGRSDGIACQVNNGSIAVRTTAKRKTDTAKANETTRTRRCLNLLAALAKKRTAANNTVL